MDDFERQLKSARLREPSQALDQRIADAIETAPSVNERRSLPLRWAVAATLAVGLAGFLAGHFSGRLAPGNPANSIAPTQPATVVKYEVIYDGRYGNPFDYTIISDDGLKPMADEKTEKKMGA